MTLFRKIARGLHVYCDELDSQPEPDFQYFKMLLLLVTKKNNVLNINSKRNLIQNILENAWHQTFKQPLISKL